MKSYHVLFLLLLVIGCKTSPYGGQLRQGLPTVTTTHFRVYYAPPETSSPYVPPSPVPTDLDYLQSIADGLETAYAAFVDRYGIDIPKIISDGSLILVRVRSDFYPKGFRDKIHLPTGLDAVSFKRTTAHELFHTLQGNMAFLNSFHVSEGLADWSVDIVNSDYDEQNFKVEAMNRWLGSLWTEGNRYSWSLFWKYVSEQEGKIPAGTFVNPDVKTESWGVDAIVRFLQALKVAYDDLGVYQAPFSIVETAFTDFLGDGSTMSDYYKRFLIALYTKDLGDPFRNLKPVDLTSVTGGGFFVIDHTPRWDFVEDEEAGYNSLVLARDGELLEKDEVLSFHNDQDAYSTGKIGFSYFAHAEPIRVNLAADVLGLYFEGQHPAETFAIGTFEDVGFAGLVHYTRLDGMGNYIRPLNGLEQTSAKQFTLYGNSIGFPYNEYRAKYIVIIPYSWNPELKPSNADGNTGRHFKFKLRGGYP